jgi:hypothetical protein
MFWAIKSSDGRGFRSDPSLMTKKFCKLFLASDLYCRVKRGRYNLGLDALHHAGCEWIVVPLVHCCHARMGGPCCASGCRSSG